MADQDLWRKNIPADYDGRFGKAFDEELSAPSINQTAIAILVICALGFAITWGMNVYFLADHEAKALPPSPLAEANERLLPPSPRLQSGPEAEMEALRHEMTTRLANFGWVDEASGVVHIPVERAMELVLQHGPPTRGVETDAQGPVELETEAASEAAMVEGSGG